MKNAIRLISAFLILAVLSGMVIAQERVKVNIDSILANARPGDIIEEPSYAIWPFYVKMEIDPQVSTPGPIQVKIYYSPILECSNATIKISEIDRLQYSGETVWYASATIGDTLLFRMNVIVPDSGSSGFRIETEGCGKKQHGYLYFVVENGLVKTSPLNLSRAARVKQPREPHQRPLNSNLRLKP